MAAAMTFLPDKPNIDRLLAVMAKLRDPDGGCPWDLEQDFASIAPYTIEEAYEVADAIQQSDMTQLRGELGDLLLQVVFHAQMAAEAAAFSFDDVAGGIAEKMIKRHPHVFGQADIDGAAAQTRAWEDQKAEERATAAANDGRALSALDGVATALPALTRAEKLQKRAARVGFDWTEAGPVIDKIAEELDELRAALGNGEGRDRVADEMGDLLFAVTNLARHVGVDPEAALRTTNAKFERRFRHIETELAKDGRAAADATLDEMEALWVAAKRAE